MDGLITRFLDEFGYTELLRLVDVRDIEVLLSFNVEPIKYFREAFAIHGQKLQFIPMADFQTCISRIYNQRANIQKFCESYRTGKYDRDLVHRVIKSYKDEFLQI